MSFLQGISQVQVFRAFRSRNYSLYFFGRGVSQFGTWMQRTAVVWLVYSITHSAFLIGVTLFAEQFPSFLFSIPGGVAADRYSRYTIIRITQVTSMVQAVLLAVLVLTGHTEIWAILLLSVLLGIINAFDVPARQSLVHEVVAHPEDLPNAVSLTTAMASLAQLLGPALSGIVLSLYGAAVCFFINAASFGGVILSLMLMHIPKAEKKKRDKPILAEFRDGLVYIRKSRELAQVILMVGLTSLLVLPYNTLIPVFVKLVYHGDAKMYGYINSFIGAGAVVATLFLASRKPGMPLKRILWVSSLVMGVAVICFSQTRNFPLAMFFAMVMGFCAMAQFTASNIICQSESDPEMRGRVIGIMLMAIFGMSPIGSLIVGAASERIGAQATVTAEGLLALVLSVLFARFMLRPKTITELQDASITEVEEEMLEH